MAGIILLRICCAALLLTLVYSDGYFDFEKHLETFDCSLVTIINYGNMDFGPLHFPTILIRYVVYVLYGRNLHYVVPIELHKNPPDKNRTGADLAKNLYPIERASLSKQWFCQVNAFLGFDVEHYRSYFYSSPEDPSAWFFIPNIFGYFWNKPMKSAQASYVNSRVVYNILIFRYNKRSYIRVLRDFRAHVFKSWISSMLYQINGNSGSEYFVWNIVKKSYQGFLKNPSYAVLDYYHHCHQCIQCRPYYPVPIKDFTQTKDRLESMITGANRMEDPKVWLLYEHPSFLGFLSRAATLNHLDEATILFNIQYTKQTTKQTTKYFREWHVHGALLNSLLPNSTFIPFRDVYKSDGSTLVDKSPFVSSQVNYCGKELFHFKMFPLLVQDFVNEFEYNYLRLPRESIKFLSCGKLTKSFFNPLLELFTAFDYASWVWILTTVLALSLTLSKINYFGQLLLRENNLKESNMLKTSFCYQFFLIFPCFLEQYSTRILTQLKKKSCFTWIAAFPFVSLYLGMHTKEKIS